MLQLQQGTPTPQAFRYPGNVQRQHALLSFIKGVENSSQKKTLDVSKSWALADWGWGGVGGLGGCNLPFQISKIKESNKTKQK